MSRTCGLGVFQLSDVSSAERQEAVPCGHAPGLCRGGGGVTDSTARRFHWPTRPTLTIRARAWSGGYDPNDWSSHATCSAAQVCGGCVWLRFFAVGAGGWAAGTQTWAPMTTNPPFPRTSRRHEQWKEDAPPPPPPAPQTPGSDERCLRGKSSFVKGSIFLCDCWYTNPWI